MSKPLLPGVDLPPRFRGRIRRRTFWIGQVYLWGLQLVVGFASLLAVVALVRAEVIAQPHLERMLEAVQFAASLVLVVWSASLYVRRLHDLGWPGALGLFPVLTGVVMGAVQLAEHWTGELDIFRLPPPPLRGAALLLFAASFVIMAAAAFVPGRSRPNRYGPPPRPDEAEGFPRPDPRLFQPPTGDPPRPIAAEGSRG